jgi:hypothetical protein
VEEAEQTQDFITPRRELVRQPAGLELEEPLTLVILRMVQLVSVAQLSRVEMPAVSRQTLVGVEVLQA